MRWTVRNKFLLVMSGLLIACLGTYLLMAATVFKSDKTQLVFDLNRSQASDLISEIETRLSGVSEKLKLFTLLPSQLQDRMTEDLFSEGSDVVSVAIFKADQPMPIRSFSQPKFLETYGLKESFFSEQTQAADRVPFDRIRHRGEALWNATTRSGPPLLGYGRLVVLQDGSGAAAEYWVAVAFVKIDHFLKSTSHLSDVVVANADGDVLISPDARLMAGNAKVPTDGLFQEARASSAKVSVMVREMNGERMVVAFAKGFNDQVLILTKTPESQVFKAVRELSIQTLLFGSIVLTVVIIVAFLLSHSLTENIALLADRMESVSEGDLTTHIDIKGSDETVMLARSFNHMIRDLKESRDDLEQMNRELDQKVKERTAQLEIQNQKVKEAQEALLRTTRLASAGEIAGRATHELLNPLTILLTRVGLMQTKVNESQRDVLGLSNEIRNAWNKDYQEGGFPQLVKNWQADSQVLPGQNLFQEDVQNLDRVASEIQSQSESFAKDIQFVKLEAERIGKILNGMRRLGHFKSDIKAHSLHAILGDCRQIMADLFEQKGFLIIEKFVAQDDCCLVDRDELIQSITNLMRNSLQSLSEIESADGKSLEVQIVTRNENGQLLIEIEDNGVGVHPEDQNKLFQSGFTTKQRDDGTGLGLGISRRFVRAFDGDLEFVKSVPFESTVFRIRIPLNTENVKHGAVA